MTHSPQHALLQWPLLVCEVLCFGLPLFALAICSPGPAAAIVRQRAMFPLRLAAIFAILWAPIALVHLTGTMADTSMSAAIPLVPEVLRGTHAGRIWIYRGVALTMLLVLAMIPGVSRSRLIGIAIVGAALLGFRAASSHAIDRGTVAVAIYCAHEYAASLWFTALFGLFVLVPNPLHAEAGEFFAIAARRVSRVAGWCLATLVATGGYAAYGGLGLAPDRLIYSSYGRMLLLKLIVVAIPVACGAFNRFRLIPAIDRLASQSALRRMVAIESGAMAAILALSSLLANTPPAH